MLRSLILITALLSNLAKADINYDSLLTTHPFESRSDICPMLLKGSLSAKELKEILAMDVDRENFNRAITFLAKMKTTSQMALVLNWERLARQIIRQSTAGWDCYRINGPHGEIGYVGGLSSQFSPERSEEAAFALWFTTDGQIFRGLIYESHLTHDHAGNHWDGVSEKTKLLPRS